MDYVEIPVVRLQKGAPLPAYSHGPEKDAGLDLCYWGADAVVLRPGERRVFPTGIAIELPPGFEGQVRPRSGLAFEHGVTVLNAPGTIDPSFRGEIKVLLINLGHAEHIFHPGERVAQLVIHSYSPARLKTVERLAPTERGGSGFGSTGA